MKLAEDAREESIKEEKTSCEDNTDASTIEQALDYEAKHISDIQFKLFLSNFSNSQISFLIWLFSFTK